MDNNHHQTPTTNERTDGRTSSHPVQSTGQTNETSGPGPSSFNHCQARSFAHIVAGLDRMSPAVEAGTTTQSKPTTNTIFAFSEWVAVNDAA